MKRRRFVATGLAAGATLFGGPGAAGAGALTLAPGAQERSGRMGSAVGYSVCRWCYKELTVDELAAAAKRLGLQSVELLDPEDWPAVVRQGLICAMVNAPGDPRLRITDGFNDPTHHPRLIPAYEEYIRRVADAGFPNLICFSGNRRGLTDEQGIENCARGLSALMPSAERFGITLCMELLNSKVDHLDYHCDHTAWGVALVARVGSPRFKLLYDIYHMQIMEGNVIATIRSNHQHIAHYHTGGVPGRHEIDGTQELNYAAVLRAIRDTGFAGYVAQEFVPTRDPLTSLAEAVSICRGRA
ncbi:MAG: TIM barrel protein [Gemmatimonadaceae bacterium]